MKSIKRFIAYVIVFAIMTYVLCKIEVRLDPLGGAHLFYDGKEVRS